MSEALTTTTGSQLPAHLRAKLGDNRGKENITQRDVRFPAIKLAQGTTVETKRSDPAYIDGLVEGEFFNSISRERYGEDPFYFSVIGYLGHRHTLFNDDRTVAETDLSDDDPRCQFTIENVNGQKVRRSPQATEFRDFLVIAEIPGRETPLIATITFKKTQLKHATTINSILESAKLPSWAWRFKAQPVAQRSKRNEPFYGWRIDQAGWSDENVDRIAEEAYTRFLATKEARERIAVVDEDPTDGAQVANDDIPF